MSTAAEVKEEIDILDPKSTPRVWTFEHGDTKRTYEQKPLSFFGKVEFISLLGDTVDKLSTEGRPLNINEMFGGEANLDSLIGVISRVAGQAPEMLLEAYCIWLRVPGEERAWVKWRLEEDLTDDDGAEILDVFIDQNAEDLVDFFNKRGKSLVEKVKAKFFSVAPPPSSKRTKRTPQDTQE